MSRDNDVGQSATSSLIPGAAGLRRRDGPDQGQDPSVRVATELARARGDEWRNESRQRRGTVRHVYFSFLSLRTSQTGSPDGTEHRTTTRLKPSPDMHHSEPICTKSVKPSPICVHCTTGKTRPGAGTNRRNNLLSITIGTKVT